MVGSHDYRLISNLFITKRRCVYMHAWVITSYIENFDVYRIVFYRLQSPIHAQIQWFFSQTAVEDKAWMGNYTIW